MQRAAYSLSCFESVWVYRVRPTPRFYLTAAVEKMFCKIKSGSSLGTRLCFAEAVEKNLRTS